MVQRPCPVVHQYSPPNLTNMLFSTPWVVLWPHSVVLPRFRSSPSLWPTCLNERSQKFSWGEESGVRSQYISIHVPITVVLSHNCGRPYVLTETPSEIVCGLSDKFSRTFTSFLLHLWPFNLVFRRWIARPV